MKTALGILAAAGLAASASAQVFVPPSATTITDGDAIFSLGNNLGGSTGSGPAASFSVNGVGGPSHIAATWWWVRVENVDTREFAVYQPTAVTTNPAGNQLRISYNYASFTLALQFTVSGFEYGYGSLTQTASLRNRSGGTQVYNLINYVDMSVNGNQTSNTASLTGPNTVEFNDLFTTATYEATNAIRVDAATNVLNLLTNNTVDNIGGGVVAGGPGHLEVASQFQFALNNNGVQSVSTTLTIIPTPGAAALLAVGGLVASRRRRA